MEQKPLSPKYDVIFKALFKKLHILTDFLKAALDLPESEYQDVRIVDPHLLRRHKQDKLGIVDLRITTKSGNSIDVELQIKPQPSILKRVLYYNAGMLVDQIQIGEDYPKINRAISILIYYSIVLKEDDAFHHCFRLYDQENKIAYPDSLEINILEIPKVHDQENSHLANWLRFFAATTAEEFIMTVQNNAVLTDAWETIKLLSGDAEVRRLAEYEEMARRDDVDRYEGALQEGLQKGRQEERLEFAQRLIRKNMSPADIVELTGLSLTEIELLAASRLTL